MSDDTAFRRCTAMSKDGSFCDGKKKWHKLWVWHHGPDTTIRRIAVRDEES